MKKVISLIAFILAFVMILSACGGTEPAQTSGSTQSTTLGTTTSSTTNTTQKPSDPTGCAHTYTVKVITQVTTSTDGKIEKTCTKCGDKVEESLAAVKSLKVLAIGNSFSVDAMEHLAVVAKAVGIEEIILGNMYIGGCSIDTHVGNANTGAKAYIYYKNTGNGWTENNNERLDSAIMDEDWDIITVQQVSQDSGRPTTYANLGRLLDFIDANKTNENAKIYWHMTWAYQQNSSHTGFANYNKDQMTMYNAIVDTVKSEIVGNSRFSGFIPSGTAVQNLRTSYIGDTLTRDGYHMSYDIGRYATALMWLKQLTGLDISNIEAIPSAYPNIIEHLTPIKEAVNAAYTNPWGVTESTNTEYINKLLEMTDADKAYLTSIGKNPDDYEVLDLGLKFNSYWDSTGKASTPNATSSISSQYITTNIFSIYELPVGSVIKIAEGYQYRPDGWTKLATAHSSATRPGNTTESIIVDESYFATFNFRAFNISRLDGEDVVYDDRHALRIYVPIVEKQKESKELTADDKAYLTGLGLNPDNYEKVLLNYTPFGYYNSTSGTTSNVICLGNGSVANNLHNFLATRLIAKAEMPTGSIIRVDEGYQYRPERFVTIGAKPAKRGDNATDNYVYVNDAWWNNHNYVGFNIAVKGNSETVTMETGTHFVIYALKTGATPVNPSGGATEEEAKKIIDSKNPDEIFTGLGYDLSKYTKIEITTNLHKYYVSTEGVSLIDNRSNCPQFWGTQIFSKDQLPNGTVIVIGKGYQYRPEGWQNNTSANTAARPGNVIGSTSDQAIVVDDTWWGNFNYRGFNVAVEGNNVNVTEGDFTVFAIYVPKA